MEATLMRVGKSGRFAARSWCLAALGFGLACGQPAPRATSRLASEYANELVSVMQANSVNRGRIDWADFRAQVLEAAEGAQTVPDLYPAIALSLRLLDDHHSSYRSASGAEVANPTFRHCAAAAVANPVLPADVGYVRVAGFSDSRPGADVAFAVAIQEQIRSRDAPHLAGWIVDIRGNTGGNMWPMIAGIGPVLGDGVAGRFVFPPGPAATTWGYAEGAALLEGSQTMCRVPAPYVLLAEWPKVAVLTDSATSSAGEAVAVSFRARLGTRSFGSASCGLSTANSFFTLSDGATLTLTIGTLADRDSTVYGGPLAPDEPVAGDSDVVARAVAWLRDGSR